MVAALLKRSNGALELVRCDQRLPGFTFAAGLRTWKVVDEQMRPWASHAEFVAAAAERRRAMAAAARAAGGEEVVDEGRRYRRTMWAPKKDSKTAAALERCVRVYPHQQNTGGFFVAIIKKVRVRLMRALSVPPPSARAPCRTQQRSHLRFGWMQIARSVTPVSIVRSRRHMLSSIYWKYSSSLTQIKGGSQVREWPEARARRQPASPPPSPSPPPPTLQRHPQLAQDCADWLRLQPHAVTCDATGDEPAVARVLLARGIKRCYLVGGRLAAHAATPAQTDAACRPISTVAVGVCVAEREATPVDGVYARWRLTPVGARALVEHAVPAACATVTATQARAMLATRYRNAVRVDRQDMACGCAYVRVEGSSVVLPAWAVARDGAVWLVATLSQEEGESIQASFDST